MNNLIPIDFKNRVIMSLEEFVKTAPQPSSLKGPYEVAMLKENGAIWSAMVPGFDLSVYDKISARYGDSQPEGGVVSVPHVDKNGYVDTYDRGCVHNQIFSDSPTCGGGWWHKKLSKEGKWNRPMPFPVDLLALFAVIKTKKLRSVTLGHRSDSFMWTDQKYRVSLNFLRSLKTVCPSVGSLTIDTRSDLVAHDDYVDALLSLQNADVKVNVNMIYCTDNEEYSRIVEPGTASFKRRGLSVKRLQESGIKADLCKEDVKFDKRAFKKAFGADQEDIWNVQHLNAKLI